MSSPLFRTRLKQLICAPVLLVFFSIPEALPAQSVSNCPSGVSATIAWNVLPWKIVKDNFGHYVANKYVAVDVAVNNCTDQTLILNAFQFHTQVVPGVTRIDLTTDPKMVRGTLVKGQKTGIRNTGVHIIKSLGLIASGATGFFKNMGSSATYGRAVTLFSDPFEKGVELIFPDTIVTYLDNWEADEVFKKGFVVSPSQTVRGRVFMPIQNLYPSPAKVKAKHLDPSEVRQKLGKISVLAMQTTGLQRAIVNPQ